jgi:hypothetical protein
MPIYDIEGAHKESGAEWKIAVEAADEAAALVIAGQKGLMVSSVKARNRHHEYDPFERVVPRDENDPAELFTYSRKPKPEDVSRYLFSIGVLLRRISFWITFWSVASLIGFGITILLLWNMWKR